MYDVVIIGAGINGCFLARDLSRYNLKVAVIEKDSDVANESTMANSAIIHTGYDPAEGTMKARLNVRGSRMYEEICHELGVSYKRTSALVVAGNSEDMETLKVLYDRAVSREITADWLSQEEALEKEPNLNTHITGALEFPDTAVIYPWELAIALMEEAVLNGADLFLNQEVIEIDPMEAGFTLSTRDQKLESRVVINAAGVHADKIYDLVSSRREFTITPRKGEYYVLDKMELPFVSRIIYPAPGKSGKGVLAVPTTHGNILIGPNSEVQQDCEDKGNTGNALAFVKEAARKTVRDVPMNKVIRTYAGLRASGSTGDFVIEQALDVPGFINVACIDSPGLASAPAISEYVIQHLLQEEMNLEGMVRKETYTKRNRAVRMAELSTEDKNLLISKNASYGNIICRCEQISEGEIVDAIHSPVGARTVKGVKKRVRPGMGRCQGGFCEPRVIEILARELGVTVDQIKLDAPGSDLILGENRGDDDHAGV